MSEAFAELYKHNVWANLRLLDACGPLTEDQLRASVPGTYGSLADTWVHLVAAEQRYVARLRGEQPGNSLREGNEFPGIEALRESVQRSGQALVEIAGGFDPGWILEGEWRGEPFKMRAIIPMMQAINHATEHRTHIMTIMTQQGVAPPDTDVWAYNEK